MKGNPLPADKMPAQAAETDPVLCELDGVLDANPLYQQVCAKLGRLAGASLLAEVLLRMLLVKPQCPSVSHRTQDQWRLAQPQRLRHAHGSL